MKASLRSKLALALIVTSAGMIAPSQGWARAPYSTSEMRSAEKSDEARIRELRDQEIKQLRIALGRRVPTNRRADLYYRLAELYLEGYHQEYVLEGRVHEKRIEKGQSDPSIDHAHSKPYLRGGITACQEILKLGISYPRMDQILYFLAFNHSELGDRKQGLHYFEEITRRFPHSPFVTEAYRELGDEAYSGSQFRKAMGYYELAAKKAPADTSPRIYHKLAWTYYRTKRFDAAISTMKKAISLSQKNGEKFLSLREEALRDMALFMTETGHVGEAITYFQQAAGDKNFYPKILERLGKQYERNVEPAKATQVYESLLKTNPDSESAFRVLVKLVDLDLRRGRFKEALARLKDYHPPRGGEEDTQVAAQNLRAMIRRTATEHHEAFRKKSNRASLAIAESYYTTYLNVFLARDDFRKETQEIQMYLAEVERELGKSKEASELYRKVVESRDPRYAKEAGALWTASLSEAIKKSTDTNKSTEPSATEKEYVEAADRLQDALGETAEGREAALRAAQVLAGYPDTRKDSVKRIRKIISTSPKTSQALTAARLWVQLQAEAPKSDEDDMKELLQNLRENQVLMAADHEIGKSKLKAAITEQETRLKVSAIARDEKEKDFSGAAQGYETFAQEATQKNIAEKAYASAVASYLKAGNHEAIDRVSSAWLKRYPKSPKAVDSIQSVATQALIQGRFEQAGSLFEKAGVTGGDAASLETAARVFEGIGQASRSQADRARFIKVQRDAVSKGIALLALAKSYESAHLDREAVQAYRDCMGISQDFEAECGVKLADVFFKLKNVTEANALLRKVAALGSKKKSKSLSPYVGYARFRLADAQEQSHAFDPMELPEEKLKKSLSQRLAFMESISRSYMSVVDAGGPWAVAALDRLGQVALSFANEVDKISPPSKLSEKGVEQFRKNLQSVSGPLRKKAVDTWTDAYKKAASAEVLSPVLPELADRLADEKVKSPARAQGFYGKLRLAGLASDGGSDGQSKSFEKTRERLSKNSQDANAWVDYGNLLWGSGKPLLAKLSYDRALQLNPKNLSAMNNRAVLLLNGEDSEENWKSVAEGYGILESVLKQDGFFISAKINRALVLNYYRLFERAKPLWEQILVRNPLADAHDGLAVALQGLGEGDRAEASLKKAEELGADSSRFAALYHRAARASLLGTSGVEKCLDDLSDLKKDSLAGFERDAVQRLKQACTLGKAQK